jgi:uncharacterized coiled-coil protein SlyX
MTDGPQAHSRDPNPGVGSPGEPPRGSTGEAHAAISSSDLEQGIAALAAQVRALAQRFTGIPPASAASQAAPPPTPAAESGTVRKASSPAPTGITSAIVAAAEAAAGEILASAEREAELIRASADGGVSGVIRALRDTISRQREMLTGLATETTRIEHSAAILQAQVRALEAEMRQALAVVDALAERES